MRSERSKMPELETPLKLTFKGHYDASNFTKDLEQATEKVLWEQRNLENGEVIVIILNVVDPIEAAEEEDLE
jgi:hypothetical protein